MNDAPNYGSGMTAQSAPAPENTQSMARPLSVMRVDVPTHMEPVENNDQVSMPIVENQVVDTLFSPVDATNEKSEAPIDLDAIVREQMEAVDAGKMETVNSDKRGIDIPLSSSENINKYHQREIISNLDNISEVIRDLTSSVQVIGNSLSYFTANAKLLTEALERVAKNGDPENKDPKYLEKVLKPNCPGIVEGLANPFSNNRGKEQVIVEGTTGMAVMTALTGGMRRVILYNSGFHIVLRRLSLEQLNTFYREMAHDDYEYGKEFGMLYYLFADINIVRYIIENLLPIVIAGSNYVHWRDTDKLMQQISDQDLSVILWAMGLMMHPKGATVNFVCAEDDCGFIQSEHTDLAKLRLINQDLVNDAMLDHFRKPGLKTDAQLDEYRKATGFNRELTFVSQDGEEKTWIVQTKQASLFDKRAVGLDYIAELRKKCSLTDAAEVYQNILYNINRCFKPWIQSISLVTKDEAGKDVKFTTVNDGTEEQDKIIMMILDEFQITVPDFEKKMREYILDTKIQHICFYFPECPKCHKEPHSGYHGYVPYDPMHAFFTLALMKLLQGASIRERQNTEKNT